jgi:hypothetical protein
MIGNLAELKEKYSHLIIRKPKCIEYIRNYGRFKNNRVSKRCNARDY